MKGIEKVKTHRALCFNRSDSRRQHLRCPTGPRAAWRL